MHLPVPRQLRRSKIKQQTHSATAIPSPGYMPVDSTRSWTVGIASQNLDSASDSVDGGLLDNLRRQCGVISAWKSDDSSTSLAATFVIDHLVKPEECSWCGSVGLANRLHIATNCQYSWRNSVMGAHITDQRIVGGSIYGVVLPTRDSLRFSVQEVES